MPLDTARARRYLKDFDLRTLFIEELGWDQHRQELVVPVDGQDFRLQAIAHKRGLVAFRCDPNAAGHVPSYPVRRKIETQVAKSVYQHLIVYSDAGHTQQVWQWVKREAGRPTAAREQTFYRDQTGEALIQKLQAVTFSLEEEEHLTLVDVAGRVRAGFDVERVTKRFYERFKAEHAGFLKFLRGIPDEAAQRWYASVMINRLMFIYFIQKKGFLDGDPNYLRTRLASSATTAPGRYYADFLRPLFFQGFARREGDRSAETNRLLGQVPYLDGGLFQEHSVERAYGGAIEIADTAFEQLFDFFDAYHWHLDERPLRADNEINPDVLGYIFEKYINQKQMGAYYTKEDITGYISLIIIAFLLDEVRRRCPASFEAAEAPSAVWQLLRDDPDRYIYPAMRHGAELPLPAEIAAGLTDVARRTEWNRPAPAEYALPTEIWREVVARRQRYEEVKAKLAAGDLRQVNDLITYNLDLRQFAQDVIASCDEPELLRAFWRAIEAITVLDPTVGSGAFLFAALNVLEPLYEGCLERMQAFVDDLDRSGEPHRPEKFSDFRKVLARVAQHPNRRYFILKSIVVNNLYGVDIMEEAVEICKLRLFLKLVAQVERVEDVEPLPDIDFNIRAGNTLVGYATREDVERALTTATDGRMKLMFEEESTALQRFEERAADVERLFGLFRQQQTELGGQVTAEDKAELRRRLDALDDELNRALSRQCGVEPSNPKAYKAWLESHRPFHWFVQFYGILKRGGFDVTVGNPPYVELSSVKSTYGVIGFETESAGNLYALCLERSLGVLTPGGRLGMVVQQPFVSTQRMQAVRSLFLGQATTIFSSTYDDRPSKLFDGMHHARIAIVLAEKAAKPISALLYVTPYNKWYKEERPTLFERLSYMRSELHERLGVFPKIGTSVEAGIVRKVNQLSSNFGLWTHPSATPNRVFYKITGVGHWFTITLRSPRFLRDGTESTSTREQVMYFADPATRDRALTVLNSSLFYWYYQMRTNCRDFNPSDYRTFPIPATLKTVNMSELAADLWQALDASSSFANVSHSLTGAIQYEQFRPREAKSVIDEIDRVLARHYGFTEEELDFIINYDIKYRMGKEEEEEAS